MDVIVHEQIGNVSSTPWFCPVRLLRLLSVPALTWSKRTTVLIVAAAAFRWGVAVTTGLSDTEAYYAQWARVPALSYYDHPPLVAWTTWLTTRFASTPGAIRIGPILYAAAFDALLCRLTARIFSPRAGFLAVVTATAIPAFLFAGFLLNPEGLLLPLWLVFLLLLLDMRTHEEWTRPLAMGAAVGVAFLAKYTAVLAIPVALLYLVGSANTRRWFRRPSLYLAGLVSLTIASPVVLWNARHHWLSVRMHISERIVQPSAESLVAALRRVGIGQLVVFQPLILPALLGVLGYALVASRRDERYRLLASASVPVLAFLLTVMVRAGDSEPHWTLIGYVPLVVAAGGLLDESTGTLRRFAYGTLRASVVLSIALTIVCLIHLHSPLLARAFPTYNPDGDPLNETMGWDRVNMAIRSHAARLGPRTVVAGAHNVLCGHLQAAMDDLPAVYCASARRTHFDFTGRRSPPPAAAVVFVDSDRYPENPRIALPDHQCRQSEIVNIEQLGMRRARYRIYDCLPVSEMFDDGLSSQRPGCAGCDGS